VYRQLVYHKKKWMSQALLSFLALMTKDTPAPAGQVQQNLAE